MGRRNVIQPYKIFDAADMSADITQASPYSTIDQVDCLSIQLDWSGTAPVGTFFVDVASQVPGTNNYSTWQSLDFGSSISISGNSGQHQLVMTVNPFQKMRLRYVRTSGIGSLTATVFAANKGA